MTTQKVASALVWKLVAAVLYTVIAAVASVVMAKLLKEENVSSSSSHMTTLRGCIVQPSGETLEDIGGLSEVKEELRRLVLLPLLHPHIFYQGPKALRPPRGVLLHGPPGTGKTMLARAIASECNVPFLALTSASLESKWMGESPKLIEAAFKLAREELAPCIVFLDEIDGVGKTRSEMDQSCTYNFKTELLRCIDGVDGASQTAPVMLLACTNCPKSLDPALRRRFPRQIAVDRPNLVERLAILKTLTKQDSTTSVKTLRAVAAKTDGKTGSDLAALYSDASAKRWSAASLQTALKTATTGDDVLQSVGPLTLKHWTTALELSL